MIQLASKVCIRVSVVDVIEGYYLDGNSYFDTLYGHDFMKTLVDIAERREMMVNGDISLSIEAVPHS